MSEEYDVFYYTDRQHTDMDDKYYEYEIRKYDTGEEDDKGQYQMWWRMRRGLVRFDRTLSDESYDYYYRQMDKDDQQNFDNRKIKRQTEKSKRTKILDETPTNVVMGAEANMQTLMGRLNVLVSSYDSRMVAVRS